MPPLRIELKSFCLRWIKRSGILLAVLALGYCFLPKPKLLPPDLEYSRTVLGGDGEVIFLTTTSDGKLRLPATVEQLAPELLEATLEMEDRRFYSHPGWIRGRSRERSGVSSRDRSSAVAPPSPCS